MKVQKKNSILIILVLFLLQTAGNAQDFKKNTFGINTDFAIHKFALHLEYQRRLTRNFGLVASFGERQYLNSFDNLKSGEIAGRIVDFGLGMQLSENRDGSGFFVEGGVNLSNTKWFANGKSRLPSSNFRPSTIGGVILGILLNGTNYETLSGESRNTEISPYGKLGYRLVNKKENFSFGPYLMIQSAPGEKELTLTNFGATKSVKIDPTQNIKGLSFGLETAFRF